MPWRRPFMDISWSFVFIIFIRFLSNAMLTTFYSALVAHLTLWSQPTGLRRQSTGLRAQTKHLTKQEGLVEE